ncbi:hypothetical protein ACO0LB_12170 [Undibacterium sp. SXout7W]|uniref:hypothetical protein n=1 Tax=Undibacterium sp. SXout7W TaxID=3413049 RepID=UPI003BF043B1
MTETHSPPSTRFVDVDGEKFACRRWGNTATDQPPLFLLQHFRGGMDHRYPLITAKGVFLTALHEDELSLSGDFAKVMWFQGLNQYLKPVESGHVKRKVISKVL